MYGNKLMNITDIQLYCYKRVNNVLGCSEGCLFKDECIEGIKRHKVILCELQALELEEILNND